MIIEKLSSLLFFSMGVYVTKPFICLQEIANKAKESGKSSILLIACHMEGTGNNPQLLANYSGLPVQYSKNYVRIIPYIAPYSFSLPWKSPWKIVYPQKRESK